MGHDIAVKDGSKPTRCDHRNCNVLFNLVERELEVYILNCRNLLLRISPTIESSQLMHHNQHWVATLFRMWIATCMPIVIGAGGEPAAIRYGLPSKLCDLENSEIAESSGLAVSRRHANVFWTHNDSGDKPRLFAFDRQGKHLGVFSAPDTENVDWEDMSSFLRDNDPCLLVGDVGDNARQRKVYSLYLFEEPQLDELRVKLLQSIPFRYEDGSHDCEGMAVDLSGPDVYLVTKEILLEAKIFRLTLPKRAPDEPLIAKLVARCRIPLATGMDISADGRRAVITTYFQAFEFTRLEGEDWPSAFSRSGRVIAMPEREQGEAICYGADNQSLYLTSEKLPTPLWEIAPERK